MGKASKLFVSKMIKRSTAIACDIAKYTVTFPYLSEVALLSDSDIVAVSKKIGAMSRDGILKEDVANSLFSEKYSLGAYCEYEAKVKLRPAFSKDGKKFISVVSGDRQGVVYLRGSGVSDIVVAVADDMFRILLFRINGDNVEVLGEFSFISYLFRRLMGITRHDIFIGAPYG